MKKIIKHLFYFKSIFVKCGKLNSFIHPLAKIKGYKKIYMNAGALINDIKLIIKNGNLLLGKDSYINSNSNIYIMDGNLKLGENSFLNNNCNVIVLGNITIGNNVLIAPNCSLISGNHIFNDNTKLICEQGYIKKNILINDDVWIGCNAIILGGVTIGRGSIVGAGSVVTKNIGEYEIWAGNPARFIKKR